MLTVRYNEPAFFLMLRVCVCGLSLAAVIKESFISEVVCVCEIVHTCQCNMTPRKRNKIGFRTEEQLAKAVGCMVLTQLTSIWLTTHSFAKLSSGLRKCFSVFSSVAFSTVMLPFQRIILILANHS